ncbi:hypothetical protein ABMA70_01290 [Halobacteriovorax sp. XZX-3]|uniref:hypothetical protein n=1 Tax=unclassified Halobacteriovorax TaxID=2639665 RepID=UPI00372101FB
MKNILKLVFALMVISNINASSNDCHYFLVLSDVDGRTDVTQKVMKVYEDKGYTFTKISNLNELPQEGSVSYMTIFSDVHHYRGAYTSVKLKDLVINDGEIVQEVESSYKLTKKPLFGSWTKSLLRSVKRKVSSCK